MTSSDDAGLRLAIETSTMQCSVALSRGTALLSERRMEGARQGPSLIGEIERLLGAHDAAVRELTGVGCSLGPGAFTGLRVGMATAKGLVYSLGVPLYAASSLEVLAAGARQHIATGGVVAPLIDARRGQVYGAAFTRGLDRVLPECVLDPEEMGAMLRELGPEVVCCGQGALLYRERLGLPVLEDEELSAPRASFLLALIVEGRIPALSGPEAWALPPLYIRPSDAELQRDRAKSKTSD